MVKEFMKANFSKDPIFGEMVEKADLGFCPICSKPVVTTEFKNELSRKEFQISGMCQKCQDDFFGKD
jgi:uncharacterized CHY-type Zn-finger protein